MVSRDTGSRAESMTVKPARGVLVGPTLPKAPSFNGRMPGFRPEDTGSNPVGATKFGRLDSEIIREKCRGNCKPSENDE